MRASQVASSDKLTRLQTEFHHPLEIVKAILSRETVKREVVQQAQAVWEKLLRFADLKRKFPTLHDKLDEELRVDKEQPVKKTRFFISFDFICCSSSLSFCIVELLISNLRQMTDIVWILSYDRRIGLPLFVNKLRQRWSGRRLSTIIGKTWWT
jgi:hypothetical protein